MTGLHDKILHILDRADDMTIATIRPDGFPQATTVSFVHDGPVVYFGTDATSQKARNIARCGNVSLTVNLPYADWDHIEGISAAGTAALVTDAAEIARVGALNFAKFPQLAKYVALDGGGVPALYRVTLRIVSVLDYAKGFGHTDTVELAGMAAAA